MSSSADHECRYALPIEPIWHSPVYLARTRRVTKFGGSVVVGQVGHTSRRRARKPELAQQALLLLGREVGSQQLCLGAAEGLGDLAHTGLRGQREQRRGPKSDVGAQCSEVLGTEG